VSPALCGSRAPCSTAACVRGCGCGSRSVSMGARVPAEINPALAAANRRQRHVGYHLKSRYDAALLQMKSWAKTCLPRCKRFGDHRLNVDRQAARTAIAY
jgi:hypothetical protein